VKTNIRILIQLPHINGREDKEVEKKTFPEGVLSLASPLNKHESGCREKL